MRPPIVAVTADVVVGCALPQDLSPMSPDPYHPIRFVEDIAPKMKQDIQSSSHSLLEMEPLSHCFMSFSQSAEPRSTFTPMARGLAQTTFTSPKCHKWAYCHLEGIKDIFSVPNTLEKSQAPLAAGSVLLVAIAAWKCGSASGIRCCILLMGLTYISLRGAGIE